MKAIQDPLTLDSLVNALRPCLQFSPAADLLARLPFSRRSVLAAVDKWSDELEAMLGRKLEIDRGGYTPSGRGAFGRLSAGRHASDRKTALRWKAQ